MKLTSAFIIAVVFLCFSFNACIPFKELPTEGKIKFPQHKYSNYPDTVNKSSRWDFDPVHAWNHLDIKTSSKSDNTFIGFDYVTPKKLRASLIIEEDTLATRIIKGKIKSDSCFYFKNKRSFLPPVIPLIWAYDNRRVRMYEHNDSLVMEAGANYGGMFLIMAGGQAYVKQYKYYKVD